MKSFDEVVNVPPQPFNCDACGQTIYKTPCWSCESRKAFDNAKFALKLTEKEVEFLNKPVGSAPLPPPFIVRLKRLKKLRGHRRCFQCKRFIHHHSEKQFFKCARKGEMLIDEPTTQENVNAT